MTRKVKTPQVAALPGMTPLGLSYPELPDCLDRRKHPELNRTAEDGPALAMPFLPAAPVAQAPERVYLTNRLPKMPKSVGIGWQNVEKVRMGSRWVRFKFVGAWRGMKVTHSTWERISDKKEN